MAGDQAPRAGAPENPPTATAPPAGRGSTGDGGDAGPSAPVQAGGSDGGDPRVGTAARRSRLGGRAVRLGVVRAPHGKRGARPDGARLTPLTSLRFEPETRPRGLSGVRYETYCGAATVGVFYRLHPGPERLATAGFANDLRRRRCEAGPPPDPRDFGESELAPADQGAERHGHGRARLADRGAIIRRIGSASTLLAATGFTMTEVGTLSLEGLWGNEAPIFVFVDD